MVAWREHRSFGGFTKTSGSGFDQSLANIAGSFTRGYLQQTGI